jgi:hypothetical protein
MHACVLQSALERCLQHTVVLQQQLLEANGGGGETLLLSEYVGIH